MSIREKRVHFVLDRSPVVFDSMPMVLTEFDGESAYRQVTDLLRYKEYRLVLRTSVAGVPGAYFALETSLDSNTWEAANANVGEGRVLIDAGNALCVGEWVELSNASRRNLCHLRIVGVGGNEEINPSFYHITAEFRS